MNHSEIERTKALITTLIELSSIANKLRSTPDVSDHGQRAELHIRIAVRALRKAIETLEARADCADTGKTPESSIESLEGHGTRAGWPKNLDYEI